MAAATCALGSMHGRATEPPDVVPTPEWAPATDAHVPFARVADDVPKAIVLKVVREDDRVVVEKVDVRRGHPRGYIADPDMFRARGYSFSETTLGEIRTWDPRGIRSYGELPDGTLEEKHVTARRGGSWLFVPFVPGMKAVEFTTPERQSLGALDLQAVIEEFCAQNPHDRECVDWRTAARAFVPRPPTTAAVAVPPSNQAGWNGTDVLVTINASESGGESGVRGLTYASSGAETVPTTTVVSPSVTFSITTEGLSTITYFASDRASNVSVPASLTVRIDKTAPTVNIVSPRATSYVINAVVSSDYQCADGVSGIQSCLGSVVAGAPIDTSVLGDHGFTVTARDVADNSWHQAVTYHVGYGVCDLRHSDVHPAGSVAPIRLQICDAGRRNLSSPAIALVADALVSTTTGREWPARNVAGGEDTSFRFVPPTGASDVGAYMFNLTTRGVPSGTYELRFRATGDSRPLYLKVNLK